jgi:hypothetical protein
MHNMTTRTENMISWTEKELERYRQLICSESVSAGCEDCKRTEFDIDNCFQELRTEIALDRLHYRLG